MGKWKELAQPDDIHTCHADCQKPACVAARKAAAGKRETMKPTQEQVIAWARGAGFEVYDEDRFMNTHISDTLVHIHTAAENLAALAYEAGRKDENEACAVEVAAIDADGWEFNMAAIIRARREQ